MLVFPVRLGREWGTLASGAAPVGGRGAKAPPPPDVEPQHSPKQPPHEGEGPRGGDEAGEGLAEGKGGAGQLPLASPVPLREKRGVLASTRGAEGGNAKVSPPPKQKHLLNHPNQLDEEVVGVGVGVGLAGAGEDAAEESEVEAVERGCVCGVGMHASEE